MSNRGDRLQRDGMVAGIGLEPTAQRMVGALADLIEITGKRAGIEAADHRLDRPDRVRGHRQRAEAEREYEEAHGSHARP